jgi:LysR family transcriptional regulator, transcriptional activator of nhaA
VWNSTLFFAGRIQLANINYNHLRYFWAVAHEGNLTRAAVHLHVSQSAVSMQIQKLEAELGHALFERRGKQLLLTEAGRITLDHADSIFATGDELVGTLKERGGSTRSVLRVGAIATLSRNLQIQFLKPLIGRDDVEIVVRSGAFGELLQSLESHRIDVVLANIDPPRDAATPWIPHAIGSQPVSLVGHPENVRPGRTLKDILANEPLILPSVETSMRAGFDTLVYRLGIHPRIAAEVDDMAMLRLLAREHKGFTVVPPIVVKDELASGELVEIAVLPDLVETFFAITMTRRFPNPLLRALISDRPDNLGGTLLDS